MKVVAVSQRVDVVAARSERRDALDQRLSRWLLSARCLPLPVPNGITRDNPEPEKIALKLNDWLETLKPAAIVLSGGNDIGECPERDDTEGQLIDWAKQRRVPLLGICRGLQMMGVWGGVKLKSIGGHSGTRHMLSGAIAREVNSFHNFALVECPQGFEVLARSLDGEIEAIRHLNLPWEAWMWHPERESDADPRDLDRLKALFT